MPTMLPYKTERWILYAHRVAVIAGTLLTAIGCIIAVVAFISPFDQDLRYWYAVSVLAASTPLWVVTWLLRQAQVRSW